MLHLEPRAARRESHTSLSEERRPPAIVGLLLCSYDRVGAFHRTLRVLAGEAPELDPSCYGRVVAPTEDAAKGTELVFVLGGDGTLLRAAELSRPALTPLLGINLGHVGFLAEVDRSDLEASTERIVAKSYDVEERLWI